MLKDTNFESSTNKTVCLSASDKARALHTNLAPMMIQLSDLDVISCTNNSLIHINTCSLTPMFSAACLRPEIVKV